MQQLDQLTNQVSTGLISNTLRGFGQRRAGIAQSASADRQHADLAEQRGCRHGARCAWRRPPLTQIQSIAVGFLCAAQQCAGRQHQRGRHHRRLGARRAEPGGRPAGYARMAASTCSPAGYRQSAGARSGPHHRYDRTRRVLCGRSTRPLANSASWNDAATVGPGDAMRPQVSPASPAPRHRSPPALQPPNDPTGLPTVQIGQNQTETVGIAGQPQRADTVDGR